MNNMCMKKQNIGGLAVLAITAVAAFNISLNSQENKLSAISMANIEALAQSEEPGITCSRSCSDGIGQCWTWDGMMGCRFKGYMWLSCRC